MQSAAAVSDMKEHVVNFAQSETGDAPPKDDAGNADQTKDSSSPVVNPSATFVQLFSQADTTDVYLMILGTLGAVLTGMSIPFSNVLFGRIIDALNKDPGNEDAFRQGINVVCVAFAVLGGINLITGFTQVYCWTVTGERQSQRFKLAYVNAILSQEVGWFDEQGASEMSTRVAELCGKVQDGLGRKASDIMQNLAQFIFAFIVAFYLCWPLSLVLIATIPCIAFAGALLINAVTSAVNDSLVQYSSAGGLATESLGAIRTVTALNVQPDIIARYRAFLIHAMNIGIVKGGKVGFANGFLFLVLLGTYALGFWYSGKLVADSLDNNCIDKGNCVTGGTVLATFFSVIMGSIALGQLAPPCSAFFAAKAAAYPILEVIHRKPLIDGMSEDGIVPKERANGRIVLDNVQFAYPSRPDTLVCKGYNLNIESGETVAFVGRSGAGKSTVMNLLLRFYDPQGGDITLDGTSTKDLNIRWLRSQLGYVGQEPVLFTGTVAENIAYGIPPWTLAGLTPSAIRDLVIEAAKLSNAHDFISEFPNGYDTDVGSNGVAMSGGQKQRIAIARALVKNPAVLLLDEATSALDATSERIVQESIDKLQRAKAQTTIVIAHRLSTIRNADKIAVVSDGVIAELGTHDELIALGGVYKDLVALQLTATNDEDKEEGEQEEQEKGEGRGRSQSKVRKLSTTKGEVESVSKIIIEDPELTKEQKRELSNRIWTTVLKHKVWLGVAFIGAALSGCVFPLWGLLLGKTQNLFYLDNPDNIRTEAGLVATWFILLGVASQIGNLLQFLGVAYVGEGVSMELRGNLFEALIRREISYFDKDENAIGAITTRLSDDSRTVHKASGEAVAKQLQALCTLAIGVGLGFSASWKLAFVVLATFPLSVAAAMVQMQALAGQQHDVSGGMGGAGGVISSAFTAFRTVSAFTMQHEVVKQYGALTQVDSDDKVKRSMGAGFGHGGAQLSMFGSYALLFWYGSTLILEGDITFENMMIAIMTLMLATFGLGAAMSDLGDQKNGLKAARRIFQTIDEGTKSSIDGLSVLGSMPTVASSGRIELKGVYFRYPTRPDVEVCKNYNITIEPGEVVAFVGPSGSGKSTIMSLLLRFYDVDAGAVMLDGVNVKDINVRWLRSQIGYVGQEPVLFNGNIRDNILKGKTPVDISMKDVLPSDIKIDYSAAVFGSPAKPPIIADVEQPLNANDIEPEIKDAAMASNAHEFIAGFPLGYNTEVGEGSIMVSGGQKQRIAIARALVKKPAVLLLDEATSALDTASEQIVQEAIDKLQQSKAQTTLVIAHRLSTIRNADKIVVIDKGQVVETGTHDALLQAEGLYFQLWSKQNGIRKNASNLSRGGSADNLMKVQL